MFDFRSATVFCLRHRLSKHKMTSTRYSKNLEACPLWLRLCTKKQDLNRKPR